MLRLLLIVALYSVGCFAGPDPIGWDCVQPEYDECTWDCWACHGEYGDDPLYDLCIDDCNVAFCQSSEW